MKNTGRQADMLTLQKKTKDGALCTSKYQNTLQSLSNKKHYATGIKLGIEKSV